MLFLFLKYENAQKIDNFYKQNKEKLLGIGTFQIILFIVFLKCNFALFFKLDYASAGIPLQHQTRIQRCKLCSKLINPTWIV